MAMLADLPADQCLHQAQVEACTKVVPRRPDPAVLPMHPFPQVVLLASHPCHPVDQATPDLTEDLPDHDQCIQDHLDGVQDSLVQVHSMAEDQARSHNMVDPQVVQDPDIMDHMVVHSTHRAQDLRDQEQDHHTDQNK